MDRNACRALIEKELNALQAASADTKRDRAPVALDQQSVGRLSRMDAMQVQAMAEETERRRGLRITALRAALNRIDDDDFGFCALCGDDIPEKRLELDPTLTTCVDCAAGA